MEVCGEFRQGKEENKKYSSSNKFNEEISLDNVSDEEINIKGIKGTDLEEIKSYSRISDNCRNQKKNLNIENKKDRRIDKEKKKRKDEDDKNISNMRKKVQ